VAETVMATYKVTVTRDGKFWLIHVPAIERWTQARRVSEIREMTQDLIEIMTGEPAETIDLDVSISLPPEVQERLDRAEELRSRAAHAQGQAAEELRGAARTLRDHGMSMREIGEVLGISYQRAHQLVSGNTKAA
jgi:DNA-directed RNA polymerase specialized sigma24 family protein